METTEFKSTINTDMMKPIAKKLIDKYSSVIGYLKPQLDKIMFVQVYATPPRVEGKISPLDLFKAVKVCKFPLQTEEIIYQTSNHRYTYKIEFKSWLYDLYDSNVIIALLYHCLRCISPNETIIQPDRCGWSELMENLGSDWCDPNCCSCENILEEDILN